MKSLPLILLLLARPSAPTDLPALRARFLSGDLVTLARGRASLAAAGTRTDLGSLGLLDDLSRLVRCLPIGPIPQGESGPYRGPRMLVRLERVRLEQLSRDGLHASSSLGALLERPPYYATEPADQRHALVLWPHERERWPNELPEAIPKEAACPRRAGEAAEKGAAHEQNRRRRARAERTLVARLLQDASALPGVVAGRIALAYLEDAEAAADRFVIPKAWLRRLEGAVDRASPPERVAARILLARSLERNGQAKAARRHYEAALQDPSITAEQDSRVRVRLVALVEPDWERVLRLIQEAKHVRPVDRQGLVNARARALFALGRQKELMTFGRRWLVETDTEGPFETQTKDLLLRLGLVMPPPEAIGWIEEISPAGGKSTQRALATLADLAVVERRFDLAVAIYDRLRLEAAAARGRLGPRAAKQQARWLRARAVVEYERRDAPAFGGFVDDILALAAREAGRPLARFAPHRAVARLTQDLMGRLANDVPVDPERRKFAALLLEAVSALAKKEGRYQKALAKYVPTLTTLAGDLAEGRVSRRRSKRRRRVRQLGEVVVPRLPPRLDPPDHPTPVPRPGSFLLYEAPSGEWVAGAPWASLVAARRAEAEAR